MHEQLWPPNVEVTFTRYWKDDERAVMHERVLNVLSHFPEFEGKKLTVGRTQRAGIAGVHPRDDPRSNRNYIRLKPGASRFTIAHELYHILTREKAVDIFALSRSPYLIDEAPSYLDLPEAVEEHPTVYAERLHKLADRAIRRFADEQEMVEWFEESLQECVSSRETVLRSGRRSTPTGAFAEPVVRGGYVREAVHRTRRRPRCSGS